MRMDEVANFNENARNDSLTSITTVSQRLSKSKLRKELIVTNTSAAGQIIYLAFGQAAVVGSGIVLAPYGAYFPPEGIIISPLELNVISSAAAGQVAIFER